MKFSKTKYASILFLLLIFILSGTETVLPLFSDFFKPAAHKEIQITSKTDNTEEKANNETEVEKKECYSLAGFDYNSSFRYALISKTFPPRNCQLKLKVFLAINTPPPKFIC